MPGEPDESLIARLHTALRGAGADLSARELSDALWLALHTPPGRAAPPVPEPAVVPPPGPADTGLPRPEHARGDTAEPVPSSARRQVYALTGTRDGGPPGAPVRIPGVRGLRHPLGIVRALRALKRSVPSAHRYELDERATAEAIADSGVLDAVLRPAGDRWLHLVLAVDDGPSMAVWRDTVGELADALRGSGIFRSVRVRPLVASAPLTGGPTVVLAVTDGVADHWYTGAAHARLAALARRAPTGVVHLFPTRLWSGTGLAAEPMTVRTTGPAPPNSLLTAHDPWLPASPRSRPALPVPVLELDERSMRSWADLIASRGGVAVLRVIDAEDPPAAVPFDADVAGGPETTAERVRAFRATASPPAYELARHLAAVDPLTLPVMRLVQAAALPGSNPVSLAEVLLSGLMHVEDSLEGQDVFAFAPDVRGVLRTVIRSGSAQRTVDVVSDFIAPRLGRTPDFPAAIADRTGTLTLPRGGEPLAELVPGHGPGGRTGGRPRLQGTHNLPARRVSRWLPALEDDVAWVGESLARAGGLPVMLYGPEGSDKTTVALEYAYRSLDDYALEWWVDARNADTMRRDLASLAQEVHTGASSAGPDHVADAERALRWLRSHGGWLLILDHATEDPEVTQLVNRIGAASGQVLVTTRHEAWPWAAASHDLTPGYRVRCDVLTGLRNGRTLREQLSGLLCDDPQADDDPQHRHLGVPSRDPGAGRRGLAVLFCALDGMGQVNRVYGPAAGDAALVGIAHRLRDAVRDDDTVTRFGDDAFVILADGLDQAEAEELAERLSSAVVKPVRADGRAVRVGARFGIGWARCGMDADGVVDSARGDLGSARDMELLLRLTDAMSELTCMEDAQGRIHFAEVLGNILARPIDLRGIRLREDVVTLVRAALNVADGEHALVQAVSVLEGAAAAERLERLLARPPAPQPVRSGLLSREDEASARTLLDKSAGNPPGNSLRDVLVDELGGLDLPTGLSPVQLFVHLLESNTQPDGLPPAVLLVDCAAQLVAWDPDHGVALARWARDWAQRAGLLTALERRRADRADVPSDPSIPGCLVVVVDVARDGSGEILVRPWFNTVMGHWQPMPGEIVTTTLDGLGTVVEAALRQLVRPVAPPHATQEHSPPYVEFVLPHDLLNHDVAGLRIRSGDGTPVPLGLQYPVHLRSLERMRSNDPLVLRQWQDRWRTLRTQGVRVHDWQESDAGRPARWRAALAAEPRCTAAVLDAPHAAASDALRAAIAEGIGLAVWDRRGVFLQERREVLTEIFAAVQRPEQLPTAIHRLRNTAYRQGGDRLIAQHLAFFWDDPTRLVDIPEAGLDADGPAARDKRPG